MESSKPLTALGAPSSASPSIEDANACCPPDSALPPLDSENEVDRSLASMARALGHPARVRILRVLLAQNTCIVGTLVEEVPLAASTVSQHLKILKDVGLIKGEVDGPRRCYCVDHAVLNRFKQLVGAL